VALVELAEIAVDEDVVDDDVPFVEITEVGDKMQLVQFVPQGIQVKVAVFG